MSAPGSLHSYCSYCGAPFAAEQAWPRVCAACGNITYRNPLPVAVAVVPVDRGLLMIRRAIAPVGALALPGGFIDLGESWQAAMARELWEETGIVIEPAAFREHCVRSSSANLLVFGMAPAMRASDLPPFVATSETSERLVVTAPPEGIAFPLHAQVVQAFFERPPRHA
ncbi:MAG TPA: NUDIX domain-containing protein [Kofleriaceae bacterium]|nr:NUDIX domain-containing protein [Kofleriaceae bacterium]